MDPTSFYDPVGRAHDFAVERCVNLSSPGVAVSGTDTDNEPAESSRGVVMQTPPTVHLEQVIGETLSQHVGAVTRDAVAGGVDGHPIFAAQWEVNDHGTVEFVRHAIDVKKRITALSVTPDFQARASR